MGVRRGNTPQMSNRARVERLRERLRDEADPRIREAIMAQLASLAGPSRETSS